MENRKLTYEDLRLGEKAKDAFLEGRQDEIRNCPIYLNTNTQGGIAGLHTTDLVIAGVLAGFPVLIGGQYGGGKSQLAFDIYNSYFGGAKSEGGQGVKIDVNPDTNIVDPVQEHYTRYSRNAQGEICPPVLLSPNVEACLHFIDEINRTPTVRQNQFYPLLNGHVTHQGKDVQVGKEDYRAVVATANLGNGLYQGTFDFDPALKNRFGLVIDTNYAMFEPTQEDRGLVSMLREADSGLKVAPIRDISDLILGAHKEIKTSSRNLSLPEKAVLWYLQEGLKGCLKKRDSTGVKEGESWFAECRDCSHNSDPNNQPACSFMGSPVFRTLEATRLYASALSYLAQLKDPKTKINAVDLMFKAFELTGAYQPFTNTDLSQGYSGHFGKFMHDAIAKLKDNFRTQEEKIMQTLNSANNGKRLVHLKLKNPTPGLPEETSYDLEEGESVDDAIINEYQVFDPFEGDNLISLGWVNTRADLLRKIAKSGGK